MEKRAVSGIMLILLFIGMLTLTFNIQPAKASGTIYIRADGSVEGTDTIQRDEDIYTFTSDINESIVVERDNIIVDGAGYTLQGTGSGTGISLSGRSNVTIKNANIKGFGTGVMGEASSYNSISGNNIANNSGGIVFWVGSNYNSVSGNSITTNDWCGIYLASSWHNSVCENNVTKNELGIRLYYSSYDVFYHNNFIDNTQQVYFLESESCYSNVWDDDYPSGGNYWSDYNGTDSDGDGVGDTPYVIDEGNTDRYPLMSPWILLEHELLVSITVPASLRIGSSSSLVAIVVNQGLNDEVNVKLSLLINGTIADLTTIPLLQAGDSYTLTYLWTPVEETYNVTAYASPVSGETSIQNNQKTKLVIVAGSPPPGSPVGVMAGDWVKITYTISGLPAGQPYPEWLKIEFLSVEGTNATVRATMHMSDGTEQTETVPVDVVAGGGEAFGLSGFVILANLTVGDTIFMSGYGNVTIAGETTRTYAGASRTVFYASFSQYGTQLTYHWDKQTGVMVEASTTSGSVTATAKTTETNMWKADPIWMQWWLWAIVAVAIVALAGATYLLKKRKPPTLTPTASTIPTEDT